MGRVSSAVAESGKYRSPYGSSSMMRMSARSAHSSSARRLSSPMSKPGGVLEVRHQIQQAHAPAFRAQAPHGVIERGQVDAVVFLRHADQVGQRVLERGDRAGVGRQLHDHGVARIDQHLGDQVEPLLRPAGDHALLERRGDAARRQDASRALRPAGRNPRVGPYWSVEPSAPLEQRRGDRPESLPRKCGRDRDSPAQTRSGPGCACPACPSCGSPTRASARRRARRIVRRSLVPGLLRMLSGHVPGPLT